MTQIVKQAYERDHADRCDIASRTLGKSNILIIKDYVNDHICNDQEWDDLYNSYLLKKISI